MTEKIRFPGTSGQTLTAPVERPSGAQPTAWALFAHRCPVHRTLQGEIAIDTREEP